MSLPHDALSVAALPFLLDSAAGVLVSTSPLDRERLSAYFFTVTASDQAPPYHSSSVNVKVIVQDVNDNAPVIEQESYDVNILEKSPIGSAILHVLAHDADSGRSAQLTYTLTHTPAAHIFQIEEHTGLLRVAKAIDRWERFIFCICPYKS